MRIGVAKEIKTHEYRVGMTPTDAKAYIAHGHSVMIEQSAGEQAGFPDSEYVAAGATIVADKAKLFDDAEMTDVTAAGPGLVAVGWVETEFSHMAAVWASPDGVNWSRITPDAELPGGDLDSRHRDLAEIVGDDADHLFGHDSPLWKDGCRVSMTSIRDL